MPEGSKRKKQTLKRKEPGRIRPRCVLTVHHDVAFHLLWAEFPFSTTRSYGCHFPQGHKADSQQFPFKIRTQKVNVNVVNV